MGKSVYLPYNIEYEDAYLANSSEHEMKKYLNYEDTEGQYFRNLIFRDHNIMLKNIIWMPGATTPIHGHRSRGCWVLVTQGELIEQVYDVNSTKPKLIDEKSLREGDITYNHNAVGYHLMKNESKNVAAITLHCYHPPYDETDIVTEDGELKSVPLTYYSKLGKVLTDQQIEGM